MSIFTRGSDFTPEIFNMVSIWFQCGWLITSFATLHGAVGYFGENSPKPSEPGSVLLGASQNV
jgi:hypothetical protein